MCTVSKAQVVRLDCGDGRVESVKAWCSAKPNSRSMQRMKALPLMCGPEKTTQDCCRGLLKVHHSITAQKRWRNAERNRERALQPFD